MNELELKRKNIEKWAKRLWLPLIIAVGGFLISPFVLTALGGLIGGAALLVVGLACVNFAPTVAIWFANWRLKAMKYAVSLNPVEQLERRLKSAHEDLAVKKERIEKTHVVAQGLASQIEEHNTKFPDRPSRHQAKFEKLCRKIDMLSKLYKKTKAQVKEFGIFVDEKRSDWEIAKTFLEANKLVDAGAKFEEDLMTDTASRTIQEGLDMAFADLETSLLDEEDVVVNATATVTVSDAKEQLQIPAKTPRFANLDLDSEEEEIEVQLVKARA
jgi:hypothetical protein